ncbi:MAG: prolipoprotein diacylglyceryl transferase [Candidatus Dadabacteria bacterium]|nr:MAG: prolipoprotein diacylglyceryl transferase [Candidatus Dadabacteria bacterium]
MHPILFQFGKLTVYTYGLFVALGFFAAIWVAGREAERLGLEPRKVQDLGLVVLIAALVGARLFYVLVEWEYFVEHPWQVFEIWKGGLVFYGGFVVAALASLAYVRHAGLPVWPTGDAVAPGLALGQALGRIGCFFAGCCYGAECDLPWAVTFTDPRGLAPLNLPLHPTQLYSALGNLGIFLVLYLGFRKRWGGTGRVFGLYLVLYPAFRFVVEFFRNDPRGALGPLSTSQALGIPLFLFGLWLLWARRGERAG